LPASFKGPANQALLVASTKNHSTKVGPVYPVTHGFDLDIGPLTADVVVTG